MIKMNINIYFWIHFSTFEYLSISVRKAVNFHFTNQFINLKATAAVFQDCL